MLCSKRVKQYTCSYMTSMIKSANKINKRSAIGLLAASGSFVGSPMFVGVGVGIGVRKPHVTVVLTRFCSS